ncbi:MAG: phage tail tape measure protein [Bacteroidales bacterium]|jgi:TP901 family phage tail tape measure protein|nr:phage tail tape measure protein [Bacteroidales bacterium]
MASGIAKLQLLVELKNKLKAGLDAAKKQVNKACGDMQGRINQFRLESAKVFDAIKSEAPGVGRAITLLKNPYVLAAAAAVALGTAIVSSTNKANEWHTKMAEINVTAELTKQELGNLSDKLLEIGSRNVAPLEEVPKAFGRIISAGLDVNTSLQTLEPTLRAAKASFTDIETVASAAVSVMMSSGENATKVYDILFETVKEGNAEFKDIAQYLPKIIPLARNVGFALDETAGAYASLTGKLSVEQSATALQGVMRALSNQSIAIGEIDKKTGKYVSGFKSIGVDVFDPATNKIRPLLDIVKDINQQMEGLSDKERMLKFDKLGLDQMGTIGFSTLMQDIAGLKKAINATANSAGASEKAYKDSLTPLEDWKIVQNQIKVQMIKIGEVFLPILSAIGKGLLWIINYSDIIGGALLGLGVAWAALNAQLIAGKIAWLGVKIASAAATAAQWLFNVAAGANPIGLIVMAVAALIGGLVMAYKKFDKFRAIIQGSWEVIKGFGNILKEFVVDRIKGIISGIGAIGNAIGKLFKGDFKGAWNSAKQGVMDLSGINAAKNAAENSKGLKDAFNNKFDQVMDAAAKKKEAEESGDFAGINNPDDDNPDNNSYGFPQPNPSEDVKTIREGSQTKNLTINIDSFIKGFTPTHQTVNSMNKEEIERWLTEMFMRVVRSAETAM